MHQFKETTNFFQIPHIISQAKYTILKVNEPPRVPCNETTIFAEIRTKNQNYIMKWYSSID
jgi:hypothetical protein